MWQCFHQYLNVGPRSYSVVWGSYTSDLFSYRLIFGIGLLYFGWGTGFSVENIATKSRHLRQDVIKEQSKIWTEAKLGDFLLHVLRAQSLSCTHTFCLHACHAVIHAPFQLLKYRYQTASQVRKQRWTTARPTPSTEVEDLTLQTIKVQCRHRMLQGEMPQICQYPFFRRVYIVHIVDFFAFARERIVQRVSG